MKMLRIVQGLVCEFSFGPLEGDPSPSVVEREAFSYRTVYIQLRLQFQSVASECGEE